MSRFELTILLFDSPFPNLLLLLFIVFLKLLEKFIQSRVNQMEMDET